MASYRASTPLSTESRNRSRASVSTRLAAIVGSIVAAIACIFPASAQIPDVHAHDHGPRCLTAELMHYAQHRDEARWQTFAAGLAISRPTNLPLTRVSPSGRFKVHYTREGENAPPLIDLNANGVPDYIDSVAYYFDVAWQVEIDRYGYAAPPAEPFDGPQTDIYITKLPPSLYGGAVPEDDNRIDGQRVHGYLILDDDYAELTYTTRGIDAVKVTSAHELHHIIEFGSYRYDLTQSSIYEATAVWFERQVHPTIPDYRQYVDTLLRTPQLFAFSTNNTGNGITGYGHVLFMDYVALRYEPAAVRKMWEEFKTQPQFTAIDAALRTYGTNLEEAYCELAEWCYHTGSRARDTLTFPEASKYPTMRPASPPRPLTSDGLFFQGSLEPLAFALHQAILPTSGSSLKDTADFLVTNAESDIGAGGNVRSTGYSIEVSLEPKPGYIAMTSKNDTVLYYKLDNNQNRHFCLSVMMNGNIFTPPAIKVSPQPFINDGVNQLLFAVKVPRDQVRNIHLWIFTLDNTPVAEVMQTGLREANGQLGMVWDGRDLNNGLAPSGVYFYMIQVDDAERVLGKFSIVRR